MVKEQLHILQETLQEIQSESLVSEDILQQSNELFIHGQCQLLSQSLNNFEFSIDDTYDDYTVSVGIIEDKKSIETTCTCNEKELCGHRIASILQVSEILKSYQFKPIEQEHKKYTREGMIQRVLDERRKKALKAEYHVRLNSNKYGEHILTSESGEKYKITLRDFEQETGYCTCPDHSTNKLGTCKHLMHLFNHIKQDVYSHRIKKKQQYPFIEVFCDPLNDYKISWYFPGNVDLKFPEISKLIQKYFGEKTYIDNPISFTGFLSEASDFKKINIRDEVFKRIEKAHNKALLKELREHVSYDLSVINADLYEYQKKGVDFGVYKDAVIIADEMGLGKTLQAISIAIMKKQVFDFKKVLIVCPASLKFQWKNEIEKFSNEKAVIAEGFPEEREQIYFNDDAYFVIVNYETVLRDHYIINKTNIDFIILDEAQRIKNYNTLTSRAIKSLQKKHALIITGTPIENRLLDLYSIVQFVDNEFLAPQWEFSYQYCLFDHKYHNQINGYYNLSDLKEKMSGILLRREKREVLNQLPNVTQLDVPVNLSMEQAELHAGFAKGVAAILAKKYRTAFDMQRLMLLLSQMRMVCDSTFLIDKETNISPKLVELENILLDKLDIKNTKRKVIIFSEWTTMLHLIGKMLRSHNIGFTELTGSVPVKNRKKLIKEFEDNEDCCVFLSSESGGAGLNLQVADTLINFELPWNPAKKNQRIGRIDRLGQESNNLTILNFITRGSIEIKIAGGLVVKQNLFDGVMNEGSTIDSVDFSAKGKAQFIEELRDAISEFTREEIEEDEELPEDSMFDEDEFDEDEFDDEYDDDEYDDDEYDEDEFEDEFDDDEFEDEYDDEFEDEFDDMYEAETEDEPDDEWDDDTDDEEDFEGYLTEKETINETEEGIYADHSEQREEQEHVPEMVTETETSTHDTSKETVTETGVPMSHKEGQANKPTTTAANDNQAASGSVEIENVMNQGVGFLSGLFKMATGKELGVSENSVKVDKETGEVTFKFKIPGM